MVAKLAAGGMSEILLARRRGPVGLEQLVVIKRMLPEMVSDPEVRGALIDEARVLLGLRHPNVGAVQELACDGDGFYLVMEYLRGDNLLAFSRALRAHGVELPLPLAVHVAVEICAGLHAAHELTDDDGEPLHVIHRDVSPQNVFVTFDGEVKLIDFGIARFANRLARTKSGVVKGKFAYMAPEQFSGETLDRRTDVFAVGVVLHELLTGERLFARSSDKEMLMAILSHPVPRPSERAPARNIPAALDEICMRALSRDPSGRFATAAAMRAALREQLPALDPSYDAREALAQLTRRVLPKRLAEVNALRRRRARRSSERITLRAIERVDPRASSEPSEEDLDFDLDIDVVEEPASSSGRLRGSGRPSGLGRLWGSERLEGSGWLWAAAALALGLVGAGAAVLAMRADAPPAPGPAAAAPGPVVSDPGAPDPGASDPAGPDPAPPSSVRVAVETIPAGAEVRLAGERRGLTPLVLELPYRREPIELGLERDGYVPMTQTVVPDQSQRLLFQLAPQPEP